MFHTRHDIEGETTCLILIASVAMPPKPRPQVLNDAFLSAANQFKQKLPELSSNQKVSNSYVRVSTVRHESSNKKSREKPPLLGSCLLSSF